MKPKMSKHYINYEELDIITTPKKKKIFKLNIKLPKINVKEIFGSKKFKFFSGLFLGGSLRLILGVMTSCSLLSPYLIPKIACDTGLMSTLGKFLCVPIYYWILIWLFRWVDYRITSLRIYYYIYKRRYEEIWKSPAMRKYIELHPDEFRSGGGCIEYDLRRTAESTELYTTPITLKYEIFKTEVLHKTRALWQGLSELKESERELHSAQTVYEVLWDILFALTILVVSVVGIYFTAFSEVLPLWARIILMVYLIIAIPVTIYRSLDRSYYIRSINHEPTDFTDEDSKFHSLYNKYFLEGYPEIYTKYTRRVIDLRAYKLQAHTRYLIKVLRLFIIV